MARNPDLDALEALDLAMSAPFGAVFRLCEERVDTGREIRLERPDAERELLLERVDRAAREAREADFDPARRREEALPDLAFEALPDLARDLVLDLGLARFVAPDERRTFFVFLDLDLVRERFPAMKGSSPGR